MGNGQSGDPAATRWATLSDVSDTVYSSMNFGDQPATLWAAAAYAARIAYRAGLQLDIGDAKIGVMTDQDPVLSAPPFAPPKRRSRRRKILILLAGVALIACFALCRYVGRGFGRIERFYTYAGYANAMSYWLCDEPRLPDSIEALERKYMASGLAEAILPPPSPFPRPWYRPVTGLTVGRYIVFVEPHHERLRENTRWIISVDVEAYAPSVECIEVSELIGRLLRDDELRRKNLEPRPERVGQEPAPRTVTSLQAADPD